MTVVAARRNAPPAHLETALLPWESADDFQALHVGYREAYRPVGPAEESLIDQLVWIDWRRRRLLLGERALHLASLQRRASVSDRDPMTRRAIGVTRLSRPDLNSARAITETDAADQASEAEWDDMIAKLDAAETRLEGETDAAYADARACLPTETAEWFDDTCNDEGGDAPDAASLGKFIRLEARPFFNSQREAARAGPLVRLQAWGESLEPKAMDTLFNLDERLTRQYEKVLGMLLRLQEMRLRK